MNQYQSDALSMDFETPSLVEILGSAEVDEFQQMFSQHPESLIVRGTLHRAGRAGFYHWHEQRRESLGWEDRDFRYSPVKRKISLGLAKICGFMTNEKGVSIELQEQRELWLINFAPQPGSLSLNGEYLAGFVQEFCSWAGLGKFYSVKVDCDNASTDKTCRILLYKEPLDD
jgi:hypothetical protein